MDMGGGGEWTWGGVDMGGENWKRSDSEVK